MIKIDFYIKFIGDTDVINNVFNDTKKTISLSMNKGENISGWKITYNRYIIKCEDRIPIKEFQNDDLIYVQLSNEMYKAWDQSIVTNANDALLAFLNMYVPEECIVLLFYTTDDTDYLGAKTIQIKISTCKNIEYTYSSEDVFGIPKDCPILEDWINYCPLYRIRNLINANK